MRPDDVIAWPAPPVPSGWPANWGERCPAIRLSGIDLALLHFSLQMTPIGIGVLMPGERIIRPVEPIEHARFGSFERKLATLQHAPGKGLLDRRVTICLARRDRASYMAIAGIRARQPHDREVFAALNREGRAWHRDGVAWTVVTDENYLLSVVTALQATASWALSERGSSEELALVATHAVRYVGWPLSRAIGDIAEMLGNLARARELFWQSVWFGPLNLDLRNVVDASSPIRLVSEEMFAKFNPLNSAINHRRTGLRRPATAVVGR